MSAFVQLIKKPGDTQIEAAVKLLVRAFKGDVSLDSMTGGNSDLQPPLFRSMLRACALDGSFYVVTDKSNKIYTIGAWFEPGKQMFSTEAQRQQGWDDYFASLPAETKDWWTDVFFSKHEGELHRLLGSDYLDGWFANIIATDPEYQRRGYATKLIKTVFQRAADEKKRVALATQSEANSQWYQKLGFQLLGMVEIPAITGAWPDFFLCCTNPTGALAYKDHRGAWDVRVRDYL